MASYSGYDTEAIKRSRAMADALFARTQQDRPIRHWSQGVAQLAEALIARQAGEKADAAEKAYKTNQQQMADALLGNTFPDAQAQVSSGLAADKPFDLTPKAMDQRTATGGIGTQVKTIANMTGDPLAALQYGQQRLDAMKPKGQFIQGQNGQVLWGNQNEGTLNELQPPTPDPVKPIVVDNVVLDPTTMKPVYTAPPKAPEPFTLNPGDVRFGPDGKRLASVPANPAQGSSAMTWRPATRADLPVYNLPDTGYLISSTGDVKQITDSRKSGQVPASMQTMEQKYLDTQDGEASRLLDLANKYTRFNTLAKDWNSQGEGIWNDIGQALSMDTSTLKSITSELIGKMRSPGEGVMTDADAKRLENATVSINQTREGNQLAERVVTAAAKRAQDRALFLRQWMADNGAGSLNKGKLAWNYYAKKFPVFDPNTGEPTEGAPDAYGWVGEQGFAAQGGSPRIPSGPIGNGQPVRITDSGPAGKAQMDALPPGPPFIAPDGSTWTKK